jgi:RHS repeat-associated protein
VRFQIKRDDGMDVKDTYFNESWQALEVRLNGDADALDQHIWDVRYIDAMVVRFHDGNIDGDYADGGDNVLYPTTDGNFNVTGLVEVSSGSVVERYSYLAYGGLSVLNADFSPDSDSTSDLVWSTFFKGLASDPLTGDNYARSRTMKASLGQWGSRDSYGYIDGHNLHEFVMSRPLRYADPFGHEVTVSGFKKDDNGIGRTRAVKFEYLTAVMQWKGIQPRFAAQRDRIVTYIDIRWEVKDLYSERSVDGFYRYFIQGYIPPLVALNMSRGSGQGGGYDKRTPDELYDSLVGNRTRSIDSAYTEGTFSATFTYKLICGRLSKAGWRAALGKEEQGTDTEQNHPTGDPNRMRYPQSARWQMPGARTLRRSGGMKQRTFMPPDSIFLGPCPPPCMTTRRSSCGRG